MNELTNKKDSFYQSTVCHCCKQYTPTLKRCSSCKLYAYCSKDHQQSHWSRHKEFCKMVNNVLIFLTTTNKNRNHIFEIPNIAEQSALEWKQTRLDVKQLWERCLNRSLTNEEQLVWMFPRVCAVCRQSRQDVLHDCTRCYSVSYCSANHEQAHSDVHEQCCQQFQLCFNINVHLFRNNNTYPDVDLKINNDLVALPVDTSEFVRACAVISDDDYSDVLTAELLSPVLTILYALEQAGFVKNRCYFQNNCTILVVGASLYEESLPWKLLCNCLLQWVKNLEQLTVVLIGPELNGGNATICSETNSGRNYTVLSERTFYHKYANSGSIAVAGLIAMFHSGLHEHEGTPGDSWPEALKQLAQLNPRQEASNVPIVLTAYTETEAHRDLQILHSHVAVQRLRIVDACAQNPYRSTRPFRDWESDTMANSQVFYHNNYVTIGLLNH